MASMPLASRRFKSEDQALFARLSGDFNPVHLDPIAARRTQAGSTVVHGMHAVLWSLDRLAEFGVLREGISAIKVQFTKFIPIDVAVELKLARQDKNAIRAELDLNGLTTTVLNLTPGKPERGGGRAFPAPLPSVASNGPPAELVRLDMALNQRGWIDMADALPAIEAQFPHASSVIGARRVAAMALLSRLVGMICPGLHSIFAAFAVSLVESEHPRDGVGFSVTGTDERFRMIRMEVTGAGLSGSVQAFLRWPPVVQASLADIMELVAPTEFTGSTALIVGGSRGLGALTAKVLAAGGGKVVITYAIGRRDAEEVAEEIGKCIARDACRVVQYDVRQDVAGQLKDVGIGISHLYYFATAAITRQKTGSFASGLFNEFTRIYVDGFYDCCRFLEGRESRPVTAFYPSSVFVDKSPLDMIEYSMAKAAGEILCAHLNRSRSRVHTIVSRLPRVLTDQTATVPPVKTGDPLEVMLPTIRRVQSFALAS
jgi:acyl dehydratase/NAD(P)-dependent dehydrogenase (short-subunit alcohol dehydrogenase family)